MRRTIVAALCMVTVGCANSFQVTAYTGATRTR